MSGILTSQTNLDWAFFVDASGRCIGASTYYLLPYYIYYNTLLGVHRQV